MPDARSLRLAAQLKIPVSTYLASGSEAAGRSDLASRPRRSVRQRLPRSCHFASEIPAVRTIVWVKLARELERRLERLVDGISATVFRGKMHPVDMANRLLRAVDLAVVDGPFGPEIGNHLRVHVHPGELAQDVDLAGLEHELSMAVTDLAEERGIRTRGAMQVTVVPDPAVRSGSVSVDTKHVEAPQPAWAQLISPDANQVAELTDNRCVIGRSDDADAVMWQPEISRHHALIWRAEGRAHIQDLGSSNGTSLNGVAVSTRPIPITPGDQLTLGPASFTFRVL
jgi:hypothetical protein